mmetsp:Transcript_83983/g.237709  ORF Transcript_83983/g.237709 Transcript_83983/m.237709 type:complete len:289 (+) Transcript_83983:1444-2310(+)
MGRKSQHRRWTRDGRENSKHAPEVPRSKQSTLHTRRLYLWRDAHVGCERCVLQVVGVFEDVVGTVPRLEREPPSVGRIRLPRRLDRANPLIDRLGNHRVLPLEAGSVFGVIGVRALLFVVTAVEGEREKGRVVGNLAAVAEVVGGTWSTRKSLPSPKLGSASEELSRAVLQKAAGGVSRTVVSQTFGKKRGSRRPQLQLPPTQPTHLDGNSFDDVMPPPGPSHAQTTGATRRRGWRSGPTTCATLEVILLDDVTPWGLVCPWCNPPNKAVVSGRRQHMNNRIALAREC